MLRVVRRNNSDVAAKPGSFIALKESLSKRSMYRKISLKMFFHRFKISPSNHFIVLLSILEDDWGYYRYYFCSL